MAHMSLYDHETGLCVQVIARRARIMYVALLNVLFYKWLGFPAGISGRHCAAVSTTVSPAHARLSMGGRGGGGLFSKVKCQMLSIPTRREAPSAPLGAQRHSFSVVDGKTPLVSLFYFGVLGLSRLHHDNHTNHYQLFILCLTKDTNISLHFMVLNKTSNIQTRGSDFSE